MGREGPASERPGVAVREACGAGYERAAEPTQRERPNPYRLVAATVTEPPAEDVMVILVV